MEEDSIGTGCFKVWLRTNTLQFTFNKNTNYTWSSAAAEGPPNMLCL